MKKLRWILTSLMVAVIAAATFGVIASLQAATSVVLIKNEAANVYMYEEGNVVKYGSLINGDTRFMWEVTDVDDAVRIKNGSTGNSMNVENQTGFVQSTTVYDVWESAKWYVSGNESKTIQNMWNEQYMNIASANENRVSYGNVSTTADTSLWVFEAYSSASGVEDDGQSGSLSDGSSASGAVTIPAAGTGSIGATVPYTRYESENGTYGGGASLAQAHDFNVQNTAAEASNQEYVKLPTNNSYVEWAVSTTGAGVTMRFTMPDASDGMGLNGSLDVFVNGSYQKTINLSSYWCWQYFSGDSPQDAPGENPRFRFDEVHFKLNSSLNVGDTIKIAKTNGDSLEYGVDFIEIEEIPAAIAQPSGSYSVTDFGAVANDGIDDMSAFNACVSAANAAGKDVYIPEGQFDLGSIWTIMAQNMKITGAGIWYTTIQFTSSNAQSGGISGHDSTTNLEFCNLYINSRLRSRYAQNAVYKCFMDTYGENSYIHDVWEEHFECGFWIADYDYPLVYTTGLVIENCRIRNNLADGVNFCQGTNNSTVINCSIRNNGDDGLACWPDATMGATVAHDNKFCYNTIENGWRAGGIAIFGGYGHRIYNNYIKDCFKGSGIRLNTVFPGYHFTPTSDIVFTDCIIINCGTSNDCYGGERGAIDLEASGDGVMDITFNGMQIYNAQRDGIQLGYGGGFSDIVFNDTYIDGTGLDVIETSRFTNPHLGAAIMSYTQNGTVTFNNLTLRNIEHPDLYVSQSNFNMILNNVTLLGNGETNLPDDPDIDPVDPDDPINPDDPVDPIDPNDPVDDPVDPVITEAYKYEAELYTAMSGIDSEACSEGTSNIGWIDAGDWIDYTINVKGGKYTLVYRSAGTGNGIVVLQQNGANLATTTLSATGAWQVWASYESTEFTLAGGQQSIRLYFEHGECNINYFEFIEVDEDQPLEDTSNLTASFYTYNNGASGYGNFPNDYTFVTSSDVNNINYGDLEALLYEKAGKSDGVAVSFKGQIKTLLAGNYNFFITGDNGFKLIINGNTVIDNWEDNWNVEKTGSINLAGDTLYDFELQYFENYGGSSLKVEWDQATNQRQVIPASAFYEAKKVEKIVPVSQSQVILVNIGENKTINRIVLTWGEIFFNNYTVSVSADGNNYSNVYIVSNGDGAIDTLSFQDISAQFVKIEGTNQSFGYSLNNLEVYGY